MNYERGNAEINVTLIVIILIVIAVFLSGYFKSDRVFWDTFNLKSVLRLPCGLTINNPSQNSKANFPVLVDGYVNGCGWNINNNGAGTVQIFDNQGLPITLPTTLNVAPESNGAPYYFKANLIFRQ